MFIFIGPDPKQQSNVGTMQGKGQGNTLANNWELQPSAKALFVLKFLSKATVW